MRAWWHPGCRSWLMALLMDALAAHFGHACWDSPQGRMRRPAGDMHRCLAGQIECVLGCAVAWGQPPRLSITGLLTVSEPSLWICRSPVA